MTMIILEQIWNWKKKHYVIMKVDGQYLIENIFCLSFKTAPWIKIKKSCSFKA